MSDLTPSAHSALDDHALAAQKLLYRNIAGGTFELTPDWGRGFSGLPDPTFNVFIPLSSAGITDDTLADTAAFFYSRKVLYTVELIHDYVPHGPDILTERRYLPLPPQPAMVLTDFSASGYLNQNVSAEIVSTVPALTAFCSLQNTVFDFEPREVLKRFPVSQLKEPRIKHYLAFVDEQPVGSGTLVQFDRMVSLWNIGTLDAYRQRGVATTLLHRMLIEAAEHDATTAMLFSTAQAFAFFKRCGFDIYAQRQWFLPPGIDYEDDDEDEE